MNSSSVGGGGSGCDGGGGDGLVYRSLVVVLCALMGPGISREKGRRWMLGAYRVTYLLPLLLMPLHLLIHTCAPLSRVRKDDVREHLKGPMGLPSRPWLR
ncbi:hypothetical protein M0802_000416 [Mischocyttarus mexicanus]|nr:hypothetical protein M0802_000416 [Mischocyttarus mexicanus]